MIWSKLITFFSYINSLSIDWFIDLPFNILIYYYMLSIYNFIPQQVDKMQTLHTLGGRENRHSPESSSLGLGSDNQGDP